jgi:hypothetical protein
LKRKSVRSSAWRAGTIIACAAFAAAAIRLPAHGAEDDSVRHYLDEKTAASVTLAREPLVFARERTDLAVNARDYLSLTAIEVNRAGERAYYWSGYIWSTIDRRDGTPVVDPGAQVVLMADGRPIRLVDEQSHSRGFGVATPPTPAPVRSAVALLSRVEPDVLSFVAGATDLSVLVVTEGVTESFTEWRDGRRELQALVRFLGVDAP